MAESVNSELSKVLTDKYLLLNIPVNLADLEDDTIIAIYLRLLKVYDNANEVTDGESLTRGLSSRQRDLKHIQRCLRPFDFAYLVPRVNSLLNKKKFPRIILELHKEIFKKFGNSFLQRVRTVIKREELSNKLPRGNCGKLSKMDEVEGNIMSQGEDEIVKPLLTQDQWLKCNDDNTHSEKIEPDVLPLDFVIPSGNQIPRTPLKWPNRSAKREKPVQSKFSAFQSNHPISEESFICTPPELFLSGPRLDCKTGNEGGKRNLATISESNSSDSFASTNSGKNSLESGHCSGGAKESSDESARSWSNDNSRSEASFNIISPPAQYKDESFKKKNRSAEKPREVARLSDVAPVMFANEDLNLRGKRKGRETYIVKKPPNCSRETFVVKKAPYVKERCVTGKSFIPEKVTCIEKPSSEVESVESPNSADKKESLSSVSLSSQEGEILFREKALLVKKVGDNTFVAVKKEKGRKTVIEKTRLSTTITEINYKKPKLKHLFPKGKDLPRTPPLGELSLLAFSPGLSNTLLNKTVNKSDILVQIYLDKTTAKNVKSEKYMDSDNSGEFDDSLSIFPVKTKVKSKESNAVIEKGTGREKYSDAVNKKVNKGSVRGGKSKREVSMSVSEKKTDKNRKEVISEESTGNKKVCHGNEREESVEKEKVMKGGRSKQKKVDQSLQNKGISKKKEENMLPDALRGKIKSKTPKTECKLEVETRTNKEVKKSPEGAAVGGSTGAKTSTMVGGYKSKQKKIILEMQVEETWAQEKTEEKIGTRKRALRNCHGQSERLPLQNEAAGIKKKSRKRNDDPDEVRKPQVMQQDNSLRPSRLCKIKASEAIAKDAMNDSP